MYDPALCRFLTMDPLAEKYYGISPYAYCANNPIRLVDSDGRKIVDPQGNVMYTHETGWTEYATPQAIRIGEAMMSTRMGTTQFNKMVNAKHSITLNLSPSKKETPDGKAKMGENWNTYDKKGNVLNSQIYIYVGSLEDFLSVSTTSKAKRYQAVVQNLDDAIGAVAVHESVHATDEDNQAISYQNATGGENHTKNDVEEEPEEAEDFVLRELFNMRYMLNLIE